MENRPGAMTTLIVPAGVFPTTQSTRIRCEGNRPEGPVRQDRRSLVRNRVAAARREYRARQVVGERLGSVVKSSVVVSYEARPEAVAEHPSFQEFSANRAARVATPPRAAAAEVIGSYRPATR